MTSIGRGLLLALVGVFGARGTIAQDGPAAASAPVIEHVLGWPAADTLYVSRHVVGRGGCGETGFYALDISRTSMRPLRMGESVCDLIGTLHGTAISRDGGFVAGMRTAMGFGPVVVALADGTADARPVRCRIPAFEPHISPDGRWIAFDGMCEAGSERVAIHVMPLDSGAHRTVASEAGHMLLAPRWSPDGSRLAYVRAPEPGSGMDGEDQVAVVQVDGGGPRVLATGRSPAWSPDGRWLAYLSDDAIRVIGVDGAGDRQLFRHRRQPRRVSGTPGGQLVWSPDGQWIAFSRSHPNGQSVWRVHVESGRLEQLTRHALEGR